MPVAPNRKTQFLNVDLDLYSKRDLRPLIAALGETVFALYAGREGKLWSAHLELAEAPRSADAAIRKFSALVRALPPAARNLWDQAKTREFNIGLQAGFSGKPLEFKLANRTLCDVASIHARVGVTIYPPEGPSKAGR
jgi:hypothetical protein